jgi:glycosyltransferase involved in cell wall biosynthesis
MSLRLLHVIDSLDPAHGGPSVVCASLAAAQASLGHEVAIVAYDTAGQRPRIDAMLADLPGADFLDLDLLPRPARGPAALLASAARRRLRGAVADADAVILHGVWDRILLAGAGAARRAGVPYAVIPHGMLRPWSLSQKRLKKRASLLLVTRRMLNAAAFLHALNADEAAAFARLGLRPPVEVIPNGVFLEQVDPLPAPGTFHAAHPALEGRPYVLFLGRLHYTKGLDVLAQAFSILTASPSAPTSPAARSSIAAPTSPAARSSPSAPSEGVARGSASAGGGSTGPAPSDLHLVIAGPDGGYRSELEARVHRLGLAGRVHLVGPIYGRDKFAALRDALCFCLPSRTEGFSVAVLEALASSCPVVISEHCHFPEVTASGAGVAAPLDPGAIAAGIARFLDPAERARAGAGGRAMVERDYTWPRIAQRSVEACRRHAPPRARARAPAPTTRRAGRDADPGPPPTPPPPTPSPSTPAG